MARLKWWVTDIEERPLRKSRTKRAALAFARREARRLNDVLELYYADEWDALSLVGKMYPEGNFSHV
jgi:hypothetical protein